MHILKYKLLDLKVKKHVIFFTPNYIKNLLDEI